MTLANINSRITFYTGVGTSQYTNANRVLGINIAQDDIVDEILRSQDGWDFDDKNASDYPIMTTNLVANQQDYSLESDTITVKRLEISYDGSTWKRASSFDVNEDGQPTDTTSIGNNYTKDNPYYDLTSGSILLYPIPDANVTNGLKIWVSRNITEFSESDLSTGTATPGIDRQFHDLIAIKTAMDWAISKGNQNASSLKTLYDEGIRKLRDFYSKKDKDTKYAFGNALPDDYGD